ncbi:MAG: MFS transporter [Actinobacteria bacterium]|nr:MFS transporter [Actinomycetota bacterium]
MSGAVGRTPLLKGLPREVAVLSAVAFCVALGFGILLPALPVFARTFDVSALQASAVISVFALARFVTAPVAGTLVDRLGERLVLGTGLFIVAGSSLAAGFSQSYMQLIVLRGVGGLGSSMFTVSALALLLRVVDDTQRGRASSAYQGGFLLGGVAGPAVGGLVVAWSIRAPFFVYAATLIVAGIVALVFLANSRLHEREEMVSGGEAGKLETLRLALKDGAYRAALAVNLITGFLILGLRSSVVPLFVTEGMQKGASLTGIGFLVAAGFQAVLLLPAGRLSDTAGRRKAMLYGTIGTTIGMIALTATDIAVNGWGTTAVAGTALFLLAMAIQGVASAFLGSAPTAVVGDIMGGKRGGIVVATFQMMNDFGVILGPLVAGLLVDLFDFDWAFAAAAGLSLIAVIFVWLMPETLNRRGSLTLRPPETPAAKELT